MPGLPAHLIIMDEFSELFEIPDFRLEVDQEQKVQSQGAFEMDHSLDSSTREGLTPDFEPNIHPDFQLPLKRSSEDGNAGPNSKRHKNEEQRVRLHDLSAKEFARFEITSSFMPWILTCYIARSNYSLVLRSLYMLAE